MLTVRNPGIKNLKPWDKRKRTLSLAQRWGIWVGRQLTLKLEMLIFLLICSVMDHWLMFHTEEDIWSYFYVNQPKGNLCNVNELGLSSALFPHCRLFLPTLSLIPIVSYRIHKQRSHSFIFLAQISSLSIHPLHWPSYLIHIFLNISKAFQTQHVKINLGSYSLPVASSHSVNATIQLHKLHKKPKGYLSFNPISKFFIKLSNFYLINILWSHILISISSSPPYPKLLSSTNLKLFVIFYVAFWPPLCISPTLPLQSTQSGLFC